MSSESENFSGRSGTFNPDKRSRFSAPQSRWQFRKTAAAGHGFGGSRFGRADAGKRCAFLGD